MLPSRSLKSPTFCQARLYLPEALAVDVRLAIYVTFLLRTLSAGT
jgi:hypothetical protein